jgi:hypothetical protein
LILSAEKIEIPGIELISPIPNRSNVMFYLYRNTTVVNRVEFVNHWHIVNSDNEALALMLRPDYDPRKQVVVQKPEKASVLPFLTETQTQQEPVIVINTQQTGEAGSNFSECETVQINEESHSLHSARFAVTNSCDGYLVFSEPYYPGWRVYVEGKQVPILRANYAFSAVFLEAGKHKVERHYRPNSVLFGTVSSLIFCGILAFIIYKKWFL